MTVFVTGGSGFIGSNFINQWIANTDEPIFNIDLYDTLLSDPNEKVPTKTYKVDINDWFHIQEIVKKHNPRAIIHFAAETEIDGSIKNPGLYTKINILGTQSILDVIKGTNIRLVYVSTDEVYGSSELYLTEDTRYAPNTPYAASKASAHHLISAYSKCYNIDAVISISGTNFGIGQARDKFIPKIISACMDNKQITLYGDGKQIRDWLFVKDHCSAIKSILENGVNSNIYNISSDNLYSNLDIANLVCDIMDEILDLSTCKSLIRFINDDKDHDKCRKLDGTKLIRELGWNPSKNFIEQIKHTIDYYLNTGVY